MSKRLELNADNKEALCLAGKALSSPTRIEIIKLLYIHSLSIAEIAERLQIPASSAALHVKVLEDANLINTIVQPGTRGTIKLCSRKYDYLTLHFESPGEPIRDTLSVSMPVGAFMDCSVTPTCGLATLEDMVGSEDIASSFYLPERINAQVLWTSSGFVEYRFPNPSTRIPKKLTFSFEICSEAANYREDWKSDLTLWINGVECCNWICPGDYGARRGRLNPEWWLMGNSQYGILTICSISDEGATVNERPTGNKKLGGLSLEGAPFISMRIGNKQNADNIGGFNIFGEKFGDYAQDIIMTLEY